MPLRDEPFVSDPRPLATLDFLPPATPVSEVEADRSLVDELLATVPPEPITVLEPVITIDEPVVRAPRAPRAAPTARVEKAPLYQRLLRLQHLRPSSWQRAIFLEGSLATAVVLALADLASAWLVLVLPLAVAVAVKFTDIIVGATKTAWPPGSTAPAWSAPPVSSRRLRRAQAIVARAAAEAQAQSDEDAQRG